MQLTRSLIQGAITMCLSGPGGASGALAGSVLTFGLVRELGTENLLLISAAFLLPCSFLGIWLLNRTPPSSEREEAPKPHGCIAQTSGWRLIMQTRYVAAIALMILLNKVVA